MYHYCYWHHAQAEGGSSSSTDPIYGEWYYQYPGATSTRANGIIAKIEDGKIFFAHVYAYTDGTSTIVYHRKNEGTYTRDGKSFTMNYTYETCDPVGSETLELTYVDGKLAVYIPASGVGLQMNKTTKENSFDSMAVIEDRNCNILSKTEKTQKRAVASTKSKSFFGRAGLN